LLYCRTVGYRLHCIETLLDDGVFGVLICLDRIVACRRDTGVSSDLDGLQLGEYQYLCVPNNSLKLTSDRAKCSIEAIDALFSIVILLGFEVSSFELDRCGSDGICKLKLSRGLTLDRLPGLLSVLRLRVAPGVLTLLAWKYPADDAWPISGVDCIEAGVPMSDNGVRSSSAK